MTHLYAGRIASCQRKGNCGRRYVLWLRLTTEQGATAGATNEVTRNRGNDGGTCRTRNRSWLLPQRDEGDAMSARTQKRRNRDDALMVVYILKERLGWSFRRIAAMGIGHSATTISTWYSTSKARVSDGSLDIIAKGARRVRLVSLGTSEDVAWINAKVHQNPCGGGRQVSTCNWEDGDE